MKQSVVYQQAFKLLIVIIHLPDFGIFHNVHNISLSIEPSLAGLLPPPGG